MVLPTELEGLVGSVVQATPLFELLVLKVKGFLLVLVFDKSPHEPFPYLVEVAPHLPMCVSLNQASQVLS